MPADPPAATLPALLDMLALRFGPREALVSARRRVTYAELAAEAAAIARGLVARGVGKGTRVGLLMPNWPEWMATAFAVWQCGGVLVALNTLHRPRELVYTLHHADVALLVAVRSFLRHDYVASLEQVVPGAGSEAPSLLDPRLPALRRIVWLDPPAPAAPLDLRPLLVGGERLGAPWPQVLAAQVSPADAATVFFTSGTTAEPKGVVHTHGALCRAAEDIAGVLGMEAEDRTWGYLPFFFMGGLAAVALATLCRGAGVVLQEVFDPGETLRLLAAERCTVFFAWPHQAEALIAHPAFPATRLYLRKGVGANTKWASAFYPPDHHAVGTYGMTETAPLCTAWPWDAPAARRAGSHGPPVSGKEIRIVDPEGGAPLPTGVEGEICVRGPTLLSHYHGQEPGDAVDAEGFFHTGDLGRLDADGALHFLGRLKDVIKTAGVNVAAAEVEAVLLGHPAVAAAHVVGVPDPARGENVAAFVVARTAVTVEALRGHCQALLASYKVPRHLWLRREDQLPEKGSGKVDKAALRAEAARLAAVRDDAARSGSPPAPRG
jgi:acyl-CoA synthetase (AMP-forming)/AMP-acid ligase II